MPNISSSTFLAGEPDLLSRIRAGASRLSFPPRGTVRCDGAPLFRTQAARDLACLLAINQDMETWSCLPSVLGLE